MSLTDTFRYNQTRPNTSTGTPLSEQLPREVRAEILPWELDDSWISSIPKSSRSESDFLSAHPARNHSTSDESWAPDSDEAEHRPVSTSAENSFGDTEESSGLISPGSVIGNIRQGPIDRDDRRPSIASATTVSSSGSKNSVAGRFHKKLQGFFGEEFTEDTSARQNSETSVTQSLSTAPSAAGTLNRNRQNSVNDSNVRSASDPPSPTASRPRTPAPSSEVTPWVFQEPPPEVSTRVSVTCLARA